MEDFETTLYFTAPNDPSVGIPSYEMKIVVPKCNCVECEECEESNKPSEHDKELADDIAKLLGQHLDTYVIASTHEQESQIVKDSFPEEEK